MATFFIYRLGHKGCAESTNISIPAIKASKPMTVPLTAKPNS